ncbi:endonuclease/exonuclease/phosphatase family protein [uncultured Jatrophihabitans sp.]|uniref:endonuclease/exonuclease/phosphatase family protein n=1 Tax=uncultured Jatrophihabitans sp. TaxID=1610747 RepID=UPI0035C96631
MRPRLRRASDGASSVVLTLVGAAAFCVAGAALLVRLYTGGWQPLIIAAAIAHQLLWAGPVAALLFLLARRWYAAAGAVVVVAVSVAGQLPVYVGAATSPHGRTVTVLQANLRVGSANPADLVRTVAARKVDVLATEELTPTERDRLIADGLTTLLPYRFDAALAGGGGGLAVWSRYPLTPDHNYRGFRLGVLSATIRLDRTHRLTFLAAHLLPPYPYPAGEWRSEMRRLRTILKTAAAGTDPVIVAGDLNATLDNQPVRGLLGTGYADAAEHAGAGYDATYPTDRWYPPLIAIDHILSRGGSAAEATTLALPGSDHHALVARIAVR